MKIDLQDVTETRKTLAVTLDANEVAAEEKSLLSQFSNMAKIPGFRPGKAPVSLIKKRYAKEVAGELKQRVMAKAYKDGSEEAKVELINVVEVEEGEIATGQDAKVTFTIDIRPDFEIVDYKGLELEGLSEEVSEKEVDDTIDNLRKEKAEFQTAERAAENGDYVKFSHEGTIDGQAISEIVEDKPVYAKMPQTWEECGTDQGLIPGLAQNLEGLATGDKKDVEVEFPADFTVEALQGKKAVYAVEVLEVRERKLPELDEKFLEAQGVKSLDDFKEQVMGYLKQQKNQQRRADLRRQVGEALAGKVEFHLPESLVDQETENTMRQVVMDNVRRGIQQEQLEGAKDEIHEGAKKTAAERVKLQLILSQIAEKESIEVGDQDFSQYVMSEAYQSGQKPDQIVKELKKDQNRIRSVQQSLLFDKTLEFLVTEAKVLDAVAKEG
ncbi:MAG: trigger factor [Verrucomicrobiota bacterium]